MSLTLQLAFKKAEYPLVKWLAVSLMSSLDQASEVSRTCSGDLAASSLGVYTLLCFSALFFTLWILQLVSIVIKAHICHCFILASLKMWLREREGHPGELQAPAAAEPPSQGGFWVEHPGEKFCGVCSQRPASG